MDGRSLVRGLVDVASPKLPASVLGHLRRDEGRQDGALPVGGAYIEYHGLGPTGASSAPWFRQQDAFNNTYRAVRVIDHRQGGLGNVLYAEFGNFDFTKVSFHEFFEMDSDRWQMHNVYNALSADAKVAWAERVSKLFACRGAKCKMTGADASHRP
jgi:hypothetical protein